MQKRFISASLIGILTVMSAGCQFGTGRSVRDLDFDWKFAKGDIPNAQTRAFDDTHWRTVQVPHDWSIEGPYSDEFASGTGYLPGGVGWYRKTFSVGPSLRNKRLSVEFDGVYNNAEVWINGIYLGKRPFGYIGFDYDLTPYVNFGGDNVLAVRVDHSAFADSRWYTGSGIYRHVRLHITNPVHIAHWGHLCDHARCCQRCRPGQGRDHREQHKQQTEDVYPEAADTGCCGPASPGGPNKRQHGRTEQ